MDALSPARELSALVALGDLRRAGEWLVARHAREVLALCRSMVRERALAEDLAQDVFAQAFSSLRSYRAEAAPRTWLLTIAKNRCIDHLRRRDHEPWEDTDEAVELDGFADDAPLPAELLSRRSALGDALDQLAEGERALIVLRFRHGLEYPELASVFGLREGTVRMRLSRALAKMRERLEQREHVAAPAVARQALDEAAPARARRPLPAAGFGGAPPPPPPAGRAADAPPAPRSSAAPPPAPAPASAMAPPRAAPAPAPVAAGPMAPPVVASAKGRGFFDWLRGLFAGAPEPELPPPPPTPLSLALAETDTEPSEGFAQRIEKLLAGL